MAEHEGEVAPKPVRAAAKKAPAEPAAPRAPAAPKAPAVPGATDAPPPLPPSTSPLPPDATLAPAPAAADPSGAEEPPAGPRSLLRRKGFWWSVAAVLVLAGDAVLASLISGWRADAADLQSQAQDLGERIAVANGIAEGQQNQIDVLTSQTDDATSTLDDLASSAGEQEASAHDFRDVALGYQACYDARGEAIAKAWAGASVVDSLATANAACAAADQSSAALAAGR